MRSAKIVYRKMSDIEVEKEIEERRSETTELEGSVDERSLSTRDMGMEQRKDRTE